MRGKKIPNPDEGNFEPIGNYVFGISKREITRISTAIGLYAVAFKRYHDLYIEGVEQELLSENGPLYRKIKKGITKNKILTRLGLTNPNRMIVMIFKEKVDMELVNQMKLNGFKITELLKCPYN